MKRKKYNDIGKGKKLLLITLGASVITPFVLLAISSLLYIGKELLKYTIKGKLEQYALQKGKLNEYTLVEKIKKEVIKECDDEMKAYRDEDMTDDEDYIYCERLKQNAMGWKTISDLERSPFSKVQQVKRAITAYHSAQNKLLEKARLLESKSMSRKDSDKKVIITRTITSRPIKTRQFKIKSVVENSFQPKMKSTIPSMNEGPKRKVKFSVNKTPNPPRWRRTGSKLPLRVIIGGAALAIIIGLIVKKIRNAIKGNALLKKNAQQNNTDQRYIDFVENQIRTGQYNELAIVESIKAQIVPMLERELQSKYSSGEISAQEYSNGKAQIDKVKSARNLEEIYSEIKTPDVKREIVAYRSAKSKIENEIAFMKQHAAMLQSAFQDAGVKGMKKGEHRMARNEEYVKSLRGGGGGNSAPANNQQSNGMSTAKKVGIGLGAAAGAAALVGGALGARKLMHNRQMAKKLAAVKVKAAAQQAAHQAEIGNKLASLKKQAAYNKSFKGRVSKLASKLKEGGKANYAKLKRKLAEHSLKSQISRAQTGRRIKNSINSLRNSFSLQ